MVNVVGFITVLSLGFVFVLGNEGFPICQPTYLPIVIYEDGGNEVFEMGWAYIERNFEYVASNYWGTNELVEVVGFNVQLEVWDFVFEYTNINSVQIHISNKLSDFPTKQDYKVDQRLNFQNALVPEEFDYQWNSTAGGSYLNLWLPFDGSQSDSLGNFYIAIRVGQWRHDADQLRYGWVMSEAWENTKTYFWNAEDDSCFGSLPGSVYIDQCYLPNEQCSYGSTNLVVDPGWIWFESQGIGLYDANDACFWYFTSPSSTYYAELTVYSNDVEPVRDGFTLGDYVFPVDTGAELRTGSNDTEELQYDYPKTILLSPNTNFDMVFWSDENYQRRGVLFSVAVKYSWQDHSCYLQSEKPYCDDSCINNCVCGSIDHCCTSNWDWECVDKARECFAQDCRFSPFTWVNAYFPW